MRWREVSPSKTMNNGLRERERFTIGNGARQESVPENAEERETKGG